MDAIHNWLVDWIPAKDQVLGNLPLPLIWVPHHKPCLGLLTVATVGEAKGSFVKGSWVSLNGERSTCHDCNIVKGTGRPEKKLFYVLI
jgi:hypothetical protein